MYLVVWKLVCGFGRKTPPGNGGEKGKPNNVGPPAANAGSVPGRSLRAQPPEACGRKTDPEPNWGIPFRSGSLPVPRAVMSGVFSGMS